jgi:hypothetical protein
MRPAVTEMTSAGLPSTARVAEESTPKVTPAERIRIALNVGFTDERWSHARAPDKPSYGTLQPLHCFRFEQIFGLSKKIHGAAISGIVRSILPELP